MNSKQTVSRNAACPCGSGLRYKYCCGASSVAVRPAAATPAYMSLMERALASQQAGDNDTAAELYEAVLATEPDEPDARNMLAVIRIAQGRMVEAFDHSRRAGELTGWSIRMITHNFIYIVRTALANADSDRVASLSLRYREWLNTAMGVSPTDSRISVLLFAGANEQAAVACLSRLEASATPIAEVVLPADLAGATGGRQYSFAVRTVAVPAGDDYQRLNALAEAASGDYLIALRCDAGATPAELAGLAALVPVVDHWTLAVPEGSADPRRSALLAESQTAGFALVSAVNLVDAESALLVPRALHLRIGGYRTAAGHPLLDYCLRLLHQAEPLIVHYSAEPDSGSRLAIRIDPGERLAALREYLRGALTEQSPPNQFAPTTGNWGMHFIGHVVTQGLFPGGNLMDRINAEITTYLHWRSCRPIIAEPGVNLVGPARGEFGLAENMRAFVRASLEAGIPCAVRDLNLALSTRQSDHSLAEHFAEEARHNCSIFFLNPDSRQLYDQSLDAVVFQRSTLNFRHVKIGYWFWELEKIPTQWADAISKVDEIWTATQFIAEAIRRVTDKPVIKVPTPIAFDVKGRYSRGHFNLPEKVFLFLFSFDFHSFAERKNPHGLIRAFRRAFPASRRDVGLVIKSINGGKKPGAIEALTDVAGDDPRILLRDAFLSRDEVFGLQSVVDAYVSLHRAEGLGLGLAESMYQGKPVIGTGYSGNLEFMNQTNSALVDYSLVPIRKGEYLYDDPGFFWAEPDEEHAAHLMRRMVDDQPYRQGLALRGRSDIRERFSNAATAERMLARLKLIGVLDMPRPRTPAAPPPKREFAMASMRYISDQKEDDRVETAKPLLLPDVLDTVYLARLPRPKFVHLLSKSLPRSGHHHLVAILSRLYGKALEYCEFYQTASSVCCKQQLCTNMCNPERMSNGSRNVSMQKSHDFNLDDPMLEPRTWLKYVVIVRPFTPAVSSEVKLFLINHFSQFLEAHQILAGSILQFHDKQLYRRALGLIDAADLRPDRQAVKSFLSQRYRYHRSFRAKWQSFAERNPEDVTCIEYDDLVGARRTETIDALVSMIGIEPDVSVATALGAEPAMTDRERGLEASRVVNEILEESRDFLNQCEALLSRPPADLASQNIE